MSILYLTKMIHLKFLSMQSAECIKDYDHIIDLKIQTLNSNFFLLSRELLLNQNYLRVLPYELGKLFQLQLLGLHGNPLSKEIMTIYQEPQGTHKLLSFMLDNLQGRFTDRLKQIFCTEKEILFFIN